MLYLKGISKIPYAAVRLPNIAKAAVLRAPAYRDETETKAAKSEAVPRSTNRMRKNGAVNIRGGMV
jgi:hypothetical protein